MEGESDDYHDYFRNNVQAYINAIVGGSLYGRLGVRVSAGDGYELYQIPDQIIIYEKGSSNQFKDCAFIVNESGKLKKSGTVKLMGFDIRLSIIGWLERMMLSGGGLGNWVIE